MTTKPTEVVVAVAFDKDGRFLMTSRPEGKVYAGYWEFPGGKVEAGESLDEALTREMKEELGVQVTDCREVYSTVFTYPHATVHLHFLHCRRRAEMSRRTDVSVLHVRRFTASDFAGDGTGISPGDGEKVVLLL